MNEVILFMGCWSCDEGMMRVSPGLWTLWAVLTMSPGLGNVYPNEGIMQISLCVWAL
jgi:hypothetical protein